MVRGEGEGWGGMQGDSSRACPSPESMDRCPIPTASDNKTMWCVVAQLM